MSTDFPELTSESDADDLPPSPVNPLRDPSDRRLPRIAGPSGLVIFGVTGDLSGFFLQLCELGMVLGAVVAQRMEVLV